MRFVFFYHSIFSDWNNGNAHFLRGVVRELQARGHETVVYEPREGWSRRHLQQEPNRAVMAEYREFFPGLEPLLYEADGPELETALAGADVVLVHEWNDPGLVARIGAFRAAGGRFLLLFHDTHHRMVTQPGAMAAEVLDGFDGVLAFGEVVRRTYLEQGWAPRAWTWHEAADTALFQPRPGREERHDLVWVGNWGDDERAAELTEFLLEPVRELGVSAQIFGVRYPREALAAVRLASIQFGGWLANHRVPEIFGSARLTLHIPRRPYAGLLPGIPTIRVFEALACGIPLISSYWEDAEGLFRVGEDFLLVRSGSEMREAIRQVLWDRDLAQSLSRSGLETIRQRHTCGHRVEELLAICSSLGVGRGMGLVTSPSENFEVKATGAKSPAAQQQPG